MKNVFCRTPLWEASKTLAAVAQGLTPAELVVKNATLINVCTGELQPHTDVACAAGRIAYVGPDASHCIGPETQVVDAGEAYLSPGAPWACTTTPTRSAIYWGPKASPS